MSEFLHILALMDHIRTSTLRNILFLIVGFLAGQAFCILRINPHLLDSVSGSAYIQGLLDGRAIEQQREYEDSCNKIKLLIGR